MGCADIKHTPFFNYFQAGNFMITLDTQEKIDARQDMIYLLMKIHKCDYTTAQRRVDVVIFLDNERK